MEEDAALQDVEEQAGQAEGNRQLERLGFLVKPWLIIMHALTLKIPIMIPYLSHLN